MPIKQVLFGFKGRLSRRDWWQSAVLLWLIQVMAVESAALVLLGFEQSLFGSVRPTLSPTRVAIEIAVAALMVWPHVAMAVKRRHDLGRAGHLAATGVALLLPLDGAARALALTDPPAGGVVAALVLATLGVRVWLFVVLGCLGGSSEDNDYGPPPARAAAEVEVFS